MPIGGAAQGPGSTRSQNVKVFPGAARIGGNVNRAAGNWGGGRVKQVSTLTVTGATNDTTYTLTFVFSDSAGNELFTRSVSYLSDASATTAEINDGLRAAVSADAVLSGWLTVAEPSATTSTFTSIDPQVTFATTDNSTDIAVAVTTTGATGAAVDFGIWVAQNGTVGGTTPAFTGLSSILTAATATAAVVYEAASEYVTEVTVAGQTYRRIVLADTDTDTTAAAIATAMNAELPANTVVVTSDAGDVEFASEVAGQPFALSVYPIGSTTGTYAVSDTSGGFYDDITNVLAGITEQSGRLESQSATSVDAAYPAGGPCSVVTRGAVAVASTATSLITGSVYVGVGAANEGLTFSSPGADRCWLPSSVARWAQDTPDGVAAYLLIDVGVTNAA